MKYYACFGMLFIALTAQSEIIHLTKATFEDLGTSVKFSGLVCSERGLCNPKTLVATKSKRMILETFNDERFSWNELPNHFKGKASFFYSKAGVLDRIYFIKD